MKIVMDSDVLIKVTKASIKDFVMSNFEVFIAPEVQKETASQGKARGYPDASEIDENIGRGMLTVAQTRKMEDVEKLITSLGLLGGEADSVRLFRQGGYSAIVSDDSRFLDLAEGLGIPYLTPGALVIYLWKNKAASKQDARRYLDKIRELISPEEYLVSVNELGKY